MGQGNGDQALILEIHGTRNFEGKRPTLEQVSGSGIVNQWSIKIMMILVNNSTAVLSSSFSMKVYKVGIQSPRG